jgi:capsular polysaccharide biosynthesis protein
MIEKIEVKGRVVNDYEVTADYVDCASFVTGRVRWFNGEWSSSTLSVFQVPDVIITSAFSAIDPCSGRYFLNQTYADAQHFFGLSPKIRNGRFKFSGDVNVWQGPHVVLGGPIDGVWHHWLIQWAARLAILKRLRPDLLENPEVRFLIDYRAYEQPFKTILEAYGIADHRMTLVDHHAHHKLPEGYLISFLDQNYYFPEVMEAHVDQIRVALGVYRKEDEPKIRLFCSRQGFLTPKRRVANFDEIKPILEVHGFQIVDLGSLDAQSQFALFSQAETVVGVHGADLAGLLFCSRGAQVLIMENERSLAMGLAGTYRTLAELRGVRHSTMQVEEVIEASVNYSDFGPQHNRDYIIDPESFRAHLEALEVL